MKRRYKKFKKSREYKQYVKPLKSLWDKYGFILLALVAGLVVGLYVLPRYFK